MKTLGQILAVIVLAILCAPLIAVAAVLAMGLVGLGACVVLLALGWGLVEGWQRKRAQHARLGF